MKTFAAVLAGALVMTTINAGVADAYLIDYQSQAGDGGFTTSVTGAAVETFDSQSALWQWSGDYLIRNSSSAISAQPYALSGVDTTNFISVPNNFSSGSATATRGTAVLGGLFNYFGLWWGSVDSYNTLDFYNNNQLVASITGSQAINPTIANGNQTAPTTNLYVNFYDLPLFDSFKMDSTQYAFEADNIAVANLAPVPEPGTMMLLGVGALCLAIISKRRSNT